MNGNENREELEARMTALLLGELSPEEADGLRERIGKERWLAELKERLARTIELVGEASVQPKTMTAPEAGAPKLSEARRGVLLETFRKPAAEVALRDSGERWYRSGWMVPLGLAASLIGLLAVVLWDSVPVWDTVQSGPGFQARTLSESLVEESRMPAVKPGATDMATLLKESGARGLGLEVPDSREGFAFEPRAKPEAIEGLAGPRPAPSLPPPQEQMMMRYGLGPPSRTAAPAALSRPGMVPSAERWEAQEMVESRGRARAEASEDELMERLLDRQASRGFGGSQIQVGSVGGGGFGGAGGGFFGGGGGGFGEMGGRAGPGGVDGGLAPPSEPGGTVALARNNPALSTEIRASRGGVVRDEFQADRLSALPPDGLSRGFSVVKPEQVGARRFEQLKATQNARLLMEMGRLGEAEKILTGVVQEDPENRPALYYLKKIEDDKFSQEQWRRQIASPGGPTQVSRSWNMPAQRELLPHARTNLVQTHASPQPPELVTRSFKVDPKTFLEGLESVGMVGLGQNLTPSELVWNVFAAAGVDFQSDPGMVADSVTGSQRTAPRKAVYFNERTGILLARATLEDLDVIERVIQALTPRSDAESETGRRDAKGAIPVPQPEVQAKENPFSTFSLNVSDVSFKLAAASLGRGVLPEPSSIRAEEFINAFDYHDPEPGPGAAVSFNWERAQYPFAHNRDVLRLAIKTAAQGREEGRPLNLVVLLDSSGSMERPDRVEMTRSALTVLARSLQARDRISLVGFARTPRLWVDGMEGGKPDELLERILELTAEGGTNLELGLEAAYEVAAKHFRPEGNNRVLLLTDGAANLGQVDPEILKRKVEHFRKQGIALDCFGIGWEGHNDDLLETLSRHGDGRYRFLNDPGRAADEFAGQLAGSLQVAAADVKVQVEFNPRRVVSWRQIGYARHQLTKEQFRDDTVDAAELGAAEAGNALYHVQLDGNGAGPIGTVRVRFRVPGTERIEERAWYVPYERTAPTLNDASHSLRLATVAGAFAEWLAKSPFAGEITPGALLGYLKGVPEAYPLDPRPKQLYGGIRELVNE